MVIQGGCSSVPACRTASLAIPVSPLLAMLSTCCGRDSTATGVTHGLPGLALGSGWCGEMRGRAGWGATNARKLGVELSLTSCAISARGRQSSIRIGLPSARFAKPSRDALRTEAAPPKSRLSRKARPAKGSSSGAGPCHFRSPKSRGCRAHRPRGAPAPRLVERERLLALVPAL